MPHDLSLMRARPELSGVTCSFEHALYYAVWWGRYAADCAPDENLHPGVHAHLIAAAVQLTAAETLNAQAPVQPRPV